MRLDWAATAKGTFAEHCRVAVNCHAEGLRRLSGSAGWDNKIRFEMLNTDTIIHFLRPPIGAWFAFHAPSIVDERGAGITQTPLYDENGAMGRVVQTMASNAPESAS